MSTSTKLLADTIDDDQRADAAEVLERLGLLDAVNHLLVAFNFEPLTAVRPQQPTAPLNQAMATQNQQPIQATATQSQQAQQTTPELPEERLSGHIEADAAIKDGNWDNLDKIYRRADMQGATKKAIREAMLGSKKGMQGMAANPQMGGLLLSAADPKNLKDRDLGQLLGDRKTEVVSEALLAIARKNKQDKNSPELNPDLHLDPELFKLLAGQIDKKTWNDEFDGLASTKQGLGPRVICGLWNGGHVGPIKELINLGVDTTLPFNVGDNSLDGNEGVWSGFVKPLQHVLGKYVKEVGEKKAGTLTFESDGHKLKIENAEAVLEHLAASGKAEVLTDWNKVKASPLVKEFRDNNPGTIWGFEEVRLPYVEAAHETATGNQPLRMWELWDAIEKEAIKPDGYDKLLTDPKAAAAEFVDKAIGAIRRNQSNQKYVHRQFGADEILGKESELLELRKEVETLKSELETLKRVPDTKIDAVESYIETSQEVTRRGSENSEP